MDKNWDTWLESIVQEGFFTFHIIGWFCREIREHILWFIVGGAADLMQTAV